MDKDTKFSKSEFKSFLNNLEKDTNTGRLDKFFLFESICKRHLIVKTFILDKPII